MTVRPVVCLVTPGTRDANNGNWRTAARWSRMLHGRYRVIVQTEWRGERADAMVALHARRSAESIARFRSLGRPLAVVLSGTDLYRDLPGSDEAIRSLDLAHRIVVLQEHALGLLAPAWARKSEVIYQSATRLRHRSHRGDYLSCAVVGHLRGEKDPLTVMRALELLPAELPVRIRHIGAPLDDALGRAARSLAQRDPRYRYNGALPHGLVRSALAAADVLIHPSIMEGGANVIVEAVTADTPVVASRISGNLGMLGSSYRGYFQAGDAAGLAQLLSRALDQPSFLRSLRAACRKRRPLFHPAAEARAIRGLVARLLA
jgi:putative glycosyltransferase (TIGR04348 family)